MIVISARVAVTALMLGLAACTYRPGADNPVARNLTWFSYAGAGDIRADCRPGAADRMRLIYNGDYDEQVRSYDVTALSAGGSPVGGKVEIRVRGPQDLTRGISLFDLFGAWRAEGRLVQGESGEPDRPAFQCCVPPRAQPLRSVWARPQRRPGSQGDAKDRPYFRGKGARR